MMAEPNLEPADRMLAQNKALARHRGHGDYRVKRLV